VPISLGDITFGIGPDTTRLRTAIGDITNFGHAVEAAARVTQGAATGATAALLRQEAAAISALQKVQAFQDRVAKSAAPTNLTAGFNQLSTTGLDRFVQRMTSGQLTAIQFQREMERFNATMNNSNRILNNWASAQRTASQNSMVESLRKLSGAAVLVAGPLSGIATRISVIATLADHFSIAWAGAIVGIAAGTYAFYKFATAAVDVERTLQNIQQTLTAVSGSEVIGQTQLKYLADFADRAGVKIEDLAKGYSQLTAAAKGTNLEGERVNKIFEGITMVGAKLGLSNEDVKGSLVAIQQMISKTTVQAEELKGQLGDRMPGAIQAFADSLGKTVPQFMKMMKAGEVTSTMLVGFVEKLKQRYGIDDATKIDTIVAAENRLATARFRLVDSLDKVIGFTSAYTNIINGMTNAINGTSDNARKLVVQVVAVGAALASAFVGSLVTSAIAGITAGVYRLAAAIATLNLASLAGGFTAIIRLLIVGATAIAAYYGAQKLMNAALEGTKQSYLSVNPAVEDYIKAQQQLASSVRGPTISYLQEQRDQLGKLLGAYSATAVAVKDIEIAQRKAAESGASDSVIAKIGKDSGLAEKKKELDDLNSAMERNKKITTELMDIYKRQTAEEERNRSDPIKELTNRQNLAVKNAQDTVNELNATYDNLFKAPAAKEFAELQNTINKQIENFRDQLTRAELPAAKVAELTDKYAAALRRTKEAEVNLSHTTSYFQAVEGVFSRGLDKSLDAWIQMVTEGKSAMEALKDTAKAVAADILKTFMTLAVLNPVKNMLFGTNYSTLGGSAGQGGLVGDLIKSFGFGGSTGGGSAQAMSAATLANNTGGAFYGPGFALGGIMSGRGPLPLNRYAGGGIANYPQYAMFGEGSKPEAYVPLPDGRSIPVNMKGAIGGGTVVNIINQGDSKIEHRNRQSQGMDVHDIIISSVSKGFVGGDFDKVGSKRVVRR